MPQASNHFNKETLDQLLATRNSPYYAQNRFKGRTTSIALTVNGGAGTHAYQSFLVHGIVEVVRLYGVFTSISDATTFNDCYWCLYYGAATEGAALTLDGVDCSNPAAPLEGAALLKTTDASALAVLLANADIPEVNENVNAEAFQKFIVTGNSSDNTRIDFSVTEDGDTDVVFTQYIDWIPLSEGAYIEVGDGSVEAGV